MFPLTSADSPKVMAISGKKIKGNDIETDFKIISSHIKSLGIVIPPLITAYLRLSQKMVSFGTTTNPELGNAFETGIMIAIKDIYPEKYERYVKTNLKSTLSYSIID